VSSFHAIDQRWRLLVPADTVVVTVDQRRSALAQLRALPTPTRVALVGGRRLHRLAKRGGVVIDAEYVVLPSLAAPVAITQIAREPLQWTTSTVLTVPSGVTRLHAPIWFAVRAVRSLPRLLSWAPAGDRIVVGARS
jgi:hypothetical protein